MDDTNGLPKLPEPLKEVAVAGYHDGVLKDALEDYFDAGQMYAMYEQGKRDALSAASGKAVAWRYRRQLSGTVFAQTRWLGMDELNHYGVDGDLVDGPHPDWQGVEYAYLHPATVTEEDVERATDAYCNICAGVNTRALRAALESFANKERE